MSPPRIGPASSLGHILRSRVLRFAVLTAILVCALVPVVAGLGKSLWRDEAWVANSVRSATLQQIFYYEDWLQTSPPLFLLLARWTVQALGTANWVFRVVPFAAYVAAVLMWWILVRRLFSQWPAIFAWTLLVLNATAVLYAGQMKQYCSDLAASTAVLLIFVLYLERPTFQRFSLLVAITSVGLLLSYPLILLMPGILVAMCIRGGWRRAAIVALPIALIFTAEYRLLIVPNANTALQTFWTSRTPDSGALTAVFSAANLLFDAVRLPIPVPLMMQRLLLTGMVAVWTALGLWACVLRFRRQAHRWVPVLVACAISWVVAITADLLKLYPISLRTSLFLLPALLLILMCPFQLMRPVAAKSLGGSLVSTSWNLAMLAMTCAIATVFVRAQWSMPLREPHEDMQAAVSFLQPAIERGDALWVHATASEAFKLYSETNVLRRPAVGEREKPVGFVGRGNTGSPCCPRPNPQKIAGDPTAAVSADMETKLPKRLPSQLWFLYSSDALNLQKGSDLSDARAYLSSRGCEEAPGVFFTGIGILVFHCGVAASAP